MATNGYSIRLTKTNVDRDTLAGMQLVADAMGISTAQLIDKMFLNYMRLYGTTQANSEKTEV